MAFVSAFARSALDQDPIFRPSCFDHDGAHFPIDLRDLSGNLEVFGPHCRHGDKTHEGDQRDNDQFHFSPTCLPVPMFLVPPSARPNVTATDSLQVAFYKSGVRRREEQSSKCFIFSDANASVGFGSELGGGGCEGGLDLREGGVENNLDDAVVANGANDKVSHCWGSRRIGSADTLAFVEFRCTWSASWREWVRSVDPQPLGGTRTAGGSAVRAFSYFGL